MIRVEFHNKSATTQQLLATKTQFQQLQATQQFRALGLMILALEWLGFYNFNIGAAWVRWSRHQRFFFFPNLVCLWIHFQCSLGWFVCGTRGTLGLIQQYQRDTSAKINKLLVPRSKLPWVFVRFGQILFLL